MRCIIIQALLSLIVVTTIACAVPHPDAEPLLTSKWHECITKVKKEMNYDDLERNFDGKKAKAYNLKNQCAKLEALDKIETDIQEQRAVLDNRAREVCAPWSGE